MKPQVSIIISTRERQEILSISLEWLKNSLGDDPRYELIVVDDNSVKPIIITSQFANAQVVKNEGRGVASARNTGAAKASADILFFLDDDMLVPGSILDRIVFLMRQPGNAAYNFNWIYPPQLIESNRKTAFGRFLEDRNFISMQGWCRGLDWKVNAIFSIRELAGASLLIPAALFKLAGGFDPSFPHAGAEDYEFSKRLKKFGIQLFVDSTITLYHNELHKANLNGFLRRVFENAITRRHALELGFNEFRQNFGPGKSLLYKITGLAYPFIITVVKLLQKFSAADRIVFRIYDLLIGLNNYRGYKGLRYAG